MNKMTNNFQKIINSCKSNKFVNINSKKRKETIYYIDDRLKKIDRFLTTIDQLLTTEDCDHAFRGEIKILLNELKFDLNGGLFYNDSL